MKNFSFALILILLLSLLGCKQNLSEDEICFNKIEKHTDFQEKFELDDQIALDFSYNVSVVTVEEYLGIYTNPNTGLELSTFKVESHFDVYSEVEEPDVVYVFEECNYYESSDQYILESNLGVSSELIVPDKVFLIFTSDYYEEENVYFYFPLNGYDDDKAYDEQTNDIKEIIQKYIDLFSIT